MHITRHALAPPRIILPLMALSYDEKLSLVNAGLAVPGLSAEGKSAASNIGDRLTAAGVFELGASSLDIHSNLPEPVRFSSNGLVLDGGLVVLGHRRLSLHRCLVIGLPLGISRSGNYEGHPTDTFSSRRCKPDAAS